jgi:hypothetical protein
MQADKSTSSTASQAKVRTTVCFNTDSSISLRYITLVSSRSQSGH